jgi:hypothetical protein
MKRLTGDRVEVRRIDSHAYICDLVRLELPLLCLYSDGKRNWFYLWCDTDREDTHRWLLFTVSRAKLAGYLKKEMSLLTVLNASDRQYMLDQTIAYSFDDKHEAILDYKRRSLHKFVQAEAKDYLPSADAYFDEDLTDDIELAQDLLPVRYDVPIDGEWFSRDFQYMFKTYENLYCFFYATRPRFVRTTRERLGESLRAPWRGGHSRVNFYSALASSIPAQHSLKVGEMDFGSPGQVEFEALATVGESIKRAVLLMTQNWKDVTHAVTVIRSVISNARLNKVDLSLVGDETVDIDPDGLAAIKNRTSEIAALLKVKEEFASLREHSPNSIVFGKAVASFVRQLERLAILQDDGMLKLEREARVQK